MGAKWSNPLTKLNVRQQLVLLFLVLISPVFWLHSYANIKAETILKAHVTSAYEELNKQNHILINRDIDTISRIMTTIIQHNQTQSLLQKENESEFDRVVKYRELNTLLGNQSVGLNGGEAIYYFLFVYDPLNHYSFAPSIPNINRRNDSASVFFYGDDTITPWIQRALDAKGKGSLSIIDHFGPRNDQTTLAYTRRVNSITNGRHFVGVLVATKMDKKIMEAFDTVTLPEGGEMYLTDWSDTILAASTSEIGIKLELPPELAESDAMEETKSVVTEHDIYVIHTKYTLNQKLVYRMPKQSLLQQQSALKWVIQTMTIAYALFAILIMIYFWRSLMDPLRRLAMFARSYAPGKKLDVRLESERNDEVGVLFYSVRNMADRINTMLHEQYTLEIKQKEAQLQLLYQQINPHLLYNTLESIYWKSLLEGNNDSAQMIKELSTLMRISLSRGKDLITIEEELEHARAYISLQQKRFEYEFSVQWELEPKAMSYRIPKITLQPLIENAILHGISKMAEDGRLTVRTALEPDAVVLTVTDNGYKPVDTPAINRMLEEAVDGPVDRPVDSGYGILNIHRRIRLHYGDEQGYGLRYGKAPDGGVRVTVTIPRILHEASSESGGEHDV